MSLARLGFQSDEIFLCSIWQDARLLVTAQVAGEDAQALIATALRLDISIAAHYARLREFPELRQTESFGVCSLTEFNALGRTRSLDTAVTHEGPAGWEPRYYAGRIGVAFVNDSILALDPAGPAVAISRRSEIRSGFEQPVCRVPLVGGGDDGLPFTTSITDQNNSGEPPIFILSSGDSVSWVTADYVRRTWGGWRRFKALRTVGKYKKRPMTVQLPNGEVVPLNVHVEKEAQSYLPDVGVPRIDGILGMDFLLRWISVFDFPRRELLLFRL